MRPDDIHRLFLEDVREKNKARSGVFHKTGKRGYVGKMVFSTDLMGRKEKKMYKGTSKVRRYNMFEVILPYDEFKEQESDRQRLLLEKWRERFSNDEIVEKMEIDRSYFYKLLNELEVPKKRKKTGGRKAKASVEHKIIPTEDAREAVSPQPSSGSEERFAMAMNGKYDAKTIAHRLRSIAKLLELENSTYEINLDLIEIEHRVSEEIIVANKLAEILKLLNTEKKPS